MGKTYLACALAAAAIRAGHTALYARTPRLLAEIGTARADGRPARLLSAWARIEVLVLDDFALQPLTDAQAADLLEVIEDRASLRSTIVTSQLPVALWHEGLGEPTVADAICDRLLAGAHRIELTADGQRSSDFERLRPPIRGCAMESRAISASPWTMSAECCSGIQSAAPLAPAESFHSGSARIQRTRTFRQRSRRARILAQRRAASSDRESILAHP